MDRALGAAAGQAPTPRENSPLVPVEAPQHQPKAFNPSGARLFPTARVSDMPKAPFGNNDKGHAFFTQVQTGEGGRREFLALANSQPHPRHKAFCAQGRQKAKAWSKAGVKGADPSPVSPLESLRVSHSADALAAKPQLHRHCSCPSSCCCCCCGGGGGCCCCFSLFLDIGSK